MGFHLGFLPYYCLILLSVASQIGPVQEATRSLAWGLDYPGFVTREGFQVPPADAYARIRLLNHPAPLLLASLLITAGVYMAAGRWRRGTGWAALRQTYSQSIASTVGIAAMVMMAIVMADTGATTLLAHGIAQASGAAFPLVSPYIGVLGSFMTGSNTNSNVMFGVLQAEAANALGIGAVTIASVQSIGGSIGSTLAPAKVLVASTLTGLSGREGRAAAAGGPVRPGTGAPGRTPGPGPEPSPDRLGQVAEAPDHAAAQAAPSTPPRHPSGAGTRLPRCCISGA